MSTQTVLVVSQGTEWQKLGLIWDPVNSIPTPWGCSKLKPSFAPTEKQYIEFVLILYISNHYTFLLKPQYPLRSLFSN